VEHENKERRAHREAEVEFPCFVLDIIDARAFLAPHAADAALGDFIEKGDFDHDKYIEFDPENELAFKYSKSTYHPAIDLTPLATVCHWRFEDLDEIAHRLRALSGATQTAVQHPKFAFRKEIKKVQNASCDTSGLLFGSIEAYSASADLIDVVNFGKRLVEDGGKCALEAMFNTKEAKHVTGAASTAGVCGPGLIGKHVANENYKTHLMGSTPSTMRTGRGYEQDRKIPGAFGGQYTIANTRRACFKHNGYLGVMGGE
jgi:hypothetical protein